MVHDYVMKKVKHFPLVHDWEYAFCIAALNDYAQGGGGIDYSTGIVPIAFYDEGLGNPNLKCVNPENDSFSTVECANCYPESKIYSIFAKFRISNNKQTSGISSSDIDASGSDQFYVPKVLNFLYGIIQTSFGDELDIVDHKTSLSIAALIGLTKESTDRQVYPVLNGTNYMATKTTDLTRISPLQPAVNSDQIMEYINFDHVLWRNANHYYTFKEKLKKILVLKSGRITGTKPITIRVKITSKTKFMNPYTFLGLFLHVPDYRSQYQAGTAAHYDVFGYSDQISSSSMDGIAVNCLILYNEWNDEFNMSQWS